MLFVLVVPLVSLYSKEDQAEEDRREQQWHLQLALPELCRANRLGHGQAAANENRGIERSNRKIQTAAAGGELRKILEPVNQIGAEHAAEKHDFGAQKPPHAERGGIALLLFVGKVMAQFRTRFVLGVFRDQRTIAQASPLREAAFFRIRTLPRSLLEFHQN